MLYDEAATASLQWSSEGSNRSTSPRHHSGHLVSFERNQQNQRAKPASESSERNQRAKPTSETSSQQPAATPSCSSTRCSWRGKQKYPLAPMCRSVLACTSCPSVCAARKAYKQHKQVRSNSTNRSDLLRHVCAQVSTGRRSTLQTLRLDFCLTCTHTPS